MSTGAELLPAGAVRYAEAILRHRATQDALRQFVPHSGQQAFIRAVLTGPYYENWAVCSNRWGKSDAGAFCDAMLARYGADSGKVAYGATTQVRDRATFGWVIGPDYQTLQHALLPKIFDNGMVPPGQSHPPFLPPWEVERWDQTRQILTLKNGSIIQAKSNEQKQIKFAAAGVDWVHFDEEPEYANYEECTLRVEAGRRLRLYGTATLLPPEGMAGGVSWVYGKIIRPHLDGTARWAVFGGSIYDNPHLLPAELERLEALYPVGSPTRRIRLGGEWLPGIGGARKYPNFSRQIHLRQQGAPNPFLPLCWCMDFNVSPLYSAVGQYHQGMFRCLKEFCLDEGSIEDMVDSFKEAYPQHPHEVWIYGDASGHARSPRDKSTIYQTILQHMRSYPSGVKLRVPVDNPPVAARVQAVNMALRDATGEMHVVIDPSLVELADDLEQVLDDGRGGIKKSSKQRDPYSRRTHMTDALGYWVFQVRPVQARTAQEQLYTNRSRRGRAVALPHYGGARPV